MTTSDFPRAHLGPWDQFIRTARPSTDWSEVGHILCLDPGETTGWALFFTGNLLACGQEATGRNPALMAEFIKEMDCQYGIPLIVYEEYRVRGNKFKEHVGSEVVTIQHIGAIKVAAEMLDIPLVKQSAGMAKGFATDNKLRRWGLYQTNQRHANDAIRHGVYWHLFGYRKEPQR